MAKNCASGILAAIAYATFGVDHAYADGPFNFSPFSTSPAAPTAPQPASGLAVPPVQPDAPEQTRVRNDNPRTTAAGFDPEALERGVEALNRISKSPKPKELLSLIKKQEEAKQQELAAKIAEFKAAQAQYESI